MQKNILIENSERMPWQSYQRQNELQECTYMKELAGKWLRVQQNNVKKSTYSNYHYHVNNYIIPYLGECNLHEITERTINDFIERVYYRLSVNTIHVILTTLKSIFKYGCKCSGIDRGLLDCCRIPHHSNESKVLTQKDSVRMKEYLMKKRDIFSVSILLCRSTGIRIGELCGLKWGDINFEDGTFRIQRTVSRVRNPVQQEGQPKTVLYIRSPKSFTSIREIPIPQYLFAKLLELKSDDDYYLLTGTTECTEPRNVQKRFKTLLKHCEMQDCNFHAMRHGFASACFENGNDCKTVSNLLGHSSTKITMDIYVHTSLSQKQKCIDSIL